MPIIKKHQTLLDFATQYAGTADALFDMAMLNGIGITDQAAPGTLLSVDEIDSLVVAAFVKKQISVATALAINYTSGISGLGYINVADPATMPIVLQKHQTLLDFATQHGGFGESLFELAVLNGIGLTDLPASGTALKITVANKKVVQAFKRSGLSIAGLVTVTPPIPGGIGYMQIENDFKVS